MVNNNKTLLKILDIMLVISILSHLGALFLTNALVLKSNPNVIMVESNPVAREMYSEFQDPPDEVVDEMNVSFFLSVFRYVWLGLMVGLYLYLRFSVLNWLKILSMCLCVGCWFVLFLFDFIGNFGYWFGKAVWG